MIYVNKPKELKMNKIDKIKKEANRATHHGKCNDCSTLITRINELEAFLDWVSGLHPSRYDEIGLRVDELRGG